MKSFQLVAGLPTSAGVLRKSQLMTTGAAGAPNDPPPPGELTRFPAALSLWKNDTPGAMSPGEPPLARLAIITAFSAALARLGSPASATASRHLGPSSWFSEVITPNLARS